MSQPDAVAALEGRVARSAVVVNRYRDSVALMRVAAAAMAIDGVHSVTVVMATEANLADAAEKGFATDADTFGSSPTANDVFIGVIGDEDACANALDEVRSSLSGRNENPGSTRSGRNDAELTLPNSLSSALHRAGGSDPFDATSVAVISVPAVFAAAEARKALGRGMHVMLFSDNVDLQAEAELKRLAGERGLLLMGPDCGTAMINGVPLGFANVVRAGSVTVIGASGTGMQEVMVHLHRLGAGVRQAIGCGGRDLHRSIGGATMIQALTMAAADDGVEAVVLISKPPDPDVLVNVAAAARSLIDRGVPVILSATGLHAGDLPESGFVVADSLEDAALLAVGRSPEAVSSEAVSSEPVSSEPVSSEPVLGGSGKTVRVVGAFSGGTLKTEFVHLLSRFPDTVSVQAIDFGDDDYTKGRPHPMIDPSQRDAEVLRALSDPDVDIVHFDVVLGFGASMDPIGSLMAQLPAVADRGPTIISAHVLGTELDPQGRDTIVRRLTDAGVNVFDTNAGAARFIRSAAPHILNAVVTS